MTAHPDGEEGFSLVEVLVVLALVSALAASLALASSQFGQLLRADRQTEARLALRQTVRHITQLLEQVEDIPILTPSDREPVRNGMLGKRNEARFVAVARRGALLQGLRDITFRVEGGGGRGVLVQLMAPRRLEPPPPQNFERIELGNTIEELTFAYFGLQGESRTPRWYDEWMNIEALPIAISVRLKVRQGDAVVTVSDVARLSR